MPVYENKNLIHINKAFIELHYHPITDCIQQKIIEFCELL